MFALTSCYICMLWRRIKKSEDEETIFKQWPVGQLRDDDDDNDDDCDDDDVVRKRRLLQRVVGRHRSDRLMLGSWSSAGIGDERADQGQAWRPPHLRRRRRQSMNEPILCRSYHSGHSLARPPVCLRVYNPDRRHKAHHSGQCAWDGRRAASCSHIGISSSGVCIYDEYGDTSYTLYGHK